MVSVSIYPILDESPFVESEELENYGEIYGDPIYDVYEDEVTIVDFVFQEDDFDNLSRAKSVRAEFVQKSVRAEIVRKSDRLIN